MAVTDSTKRDLNDLPKDLRMLLVDVFESIGLKALAIQNLSDQQIGLGPNSEVGALATAMGAIAKSIGAQTDLLEQELNPGRTYVGAGSPEYSLHKKVVRVDEGE